MTPDDLQVLAGHVGWVYDDTRYYCDHSRMIMADVKGSGITAEGMLSLLAWAKEESKRRYVSDFDLNNYAYDIADIVYDYIKGTDTDLPNAIGEAVLRAVKEGR